jgi:hypothetical protein
VQQRGDRGEVDHEPPPQRTPRRCLAPRRLSPVQRVRGSVSCCSRSAVCAKPEWLRCRSVMMISVKQAGCCFECVSGSVANF